MTLNEQICTIAIAVLTTMASRFLPFVIFNSKKPTPAFVSYLGDNLPPAILGILVVYCYKTQILHPSYESFLAAIAGLLTVGVHIYKKNMLLSILVGTVSYVAFVYLT